MPTQICRSSESHRSVELRDIVTGHAIQWEPDGTTYYVVKLDGLPATLDSTPYVACIEVGDHVGPEVRLMDGRSLVTDLGPMDFECNWPFS